MQRQNRFTAPDFRSTGGLGRRRTHLPARVLRNSGRHPASSAVACCCGSCPPEHRSTWARLWRPSARIPGFRAYANRALVRFGRPDDVSPTLAFERRSTGRPAASVARCRAQPFLESAPTRPNSLRSASCPPEYRNSPRHSGRTKRLVPRCSGGETGESSGIPGHPPRRRLTSVLRRSGGLHAQPFETSGTPEHPGCHAWPCPPGLRNSGEDLRPRHSPMPRALLRYSGTPVKAMGGESVPHRKARRRCRSLADRVLRHSGTPEHSRDFCDDSSEEGC